MMLISDVKKPEQFSLPQPLLSPFGMGVYRLEEDYTFERFGWDFTVPSGVIYDGASIPSIFWMKLFPSSVGPSHLPQYMLPALGHDWCFNTGCVSFKVANHGFYCHLLANGVNEREAKKMYLAVRTGGRKAWAKWRELD